MRPHRKPATADALLAANVMCHIPDLNGVAAGVDAFLKPDGVLGFEVRGDRPAGIAVTISLLRNANELDRRRS